MNKRKYLILDFGLLILYAGFLIGNFYVNYPKWLKVTVTAVYLILAIVRLIVILECKKD